MDTIKTIFQSHCEKSQRDFLKKYAIKNGLDYDDLVSEFITTPKFQLSVGRRQTYKSKRKRKVLDVRDQCCALLCKKGEEVRCSLRRNIDQRPYSLCTNHSIKWQEYSSPLQPDPITGKIGSYGLTLGMYCMEDGITRVPRPYLYDENFPAWKDIDIKADISDDDEEDDDISDTQTFICEKIGQYYLKKLTYDAESSDVYSIGDSGEGDYVGEIRGAVKIVDNRLVSGTLYLEDEQDSSDSDDDM